MKLLHLLLLFSVLSLPASARAADPSSFFFTSSPRSWVGQGQSVTGTVATGFSFSAVRNVFNGVSLTISSPTHRWFLDFAAPDNALLTPGNYSFVTSFHHPQPGLPAMSFSTDTRVADTLIGFFEVQAVEYGPGNTILLFTANFLQYDNRDFTQPNQGSIHFVAVPEPSVFALAGAGLLVLCFRRRTRPSRSGCPPRLPRAESLSLGR